MSAVAGSLERDYMKHKRRYIYTALEELDFHWDIQDVWAFQEMWERGWDCGQIAERLGRTQEEVAVLVIDRANKGEISIRPGGWFGTKREGSK